MNIFAPSYKRSDGVKTHKIIPQVKYCVHEFEKEKYQQAGHDVIVLPDETRGNIAKVRNYIKDNYIPDDGIIIDDDIENIMQWTFEGLEPKAKKVTDFEQFFELGFLLCKEWGAKLWGVNILGDKGSYREYTPFGTISPISASFMGFTENKIRFDDRLPLKDDYDFCISNLNEHRKIVRLNAYSLVKKDHGNKGGCADYRNIEREKQQFDLLQKKWGSVIVKADARAEFDINPVLNVPIGGV